MPKWKDAPIVEKEEEIVSKPTSRWKQAFPVEKQYKMKTPIGEEVFPTSLHKPGLGGVAERALEFMSYPVRLGGAYRTDPETGEKYKVTDPKSAFWRPEAEKAKKAIPGEGLPSKAARFGVDIAADIASDPSMLSLGAGAVRKAGTGLAKLPYKGALTLSKEATGIPKQALETAATGSGRKALKEAFGSQYEIAEDIVNKVLNFDDYIPEKTVVQQALKDTPANLSTENVIKELQSHINKRATGVQKDTNRMINNLITDIKEQWGESLSAEDFYELRKVLDKQIEGKWNIEGGSDFVNAIKATRRLMKDKLIESAPPEYADAMQEWARKLALLEKFNKYVGTNKLTKQERTERLISNLFGKDKEKRQQVIKELGDLFGEDYISQAQLAKFAADVGEGGVPSWLPKHFTGRSALGILAGSALGSPLTGLAVSSPKLTTGVLLPGLKGVEKGTEKFLRAGEAAARPVQSVAGLPGIATSLHRTKEQYDPEEEEKIRKYRRLLRR